jgi:parallel beta-helix repeat protein
MSDAYEGIDTVAISFQIPKTDPGFNADSGFWTIKPSSRLNTMYTKHVIINGMSQSEFIGEDTNPYGPEIEISGESISAHADCFSFYQSSLELIHVCINRFTSAGVTLWGSPHAIIAGCYIGLRPYGWKDAGNASGIHVYDKCKNVHIVPLDTIPNIIGGNDGGAICVEDSSTHSFIAGNIIGLNRTRTEVIGGEQGIGIYFNKMCDSNTVVENWIGGSLIGIGIWKSNDNLVAGNKIGTDTAWTTELSNSLYGINIGEDSKRNKIIGNLIGNNSEDGIRIKGSKAMYNTISENAISMNESKGICLLDTANGGIAAPQITHVLENEIFGTSPPNSMIEIFTDNDDEGRIFQAVVSSDSAGNWGWVGQIHGVFDSIRATATDTSGNTSEFGKYVPVKDPSSIEGSSEPIPFTLSNNYPGQISTEIRICFDLPGQADVNLDVFNLSGAKVAEIHRGRLHAGYYSLTWNTSSHAAGVYLIRMQTERGALTRKCVVQK